MYQLTPISSNRKTGPIPVSTSEAGTCPPSCAMAGACYAKSGKLALHWRKVTEGQRGGTWADFIRSVRELPKRIMWRHNQAGDLPGRGDRISIAKLAELVRANRGKRGFTYTHKPLHRRDEREAIRAANDAGFTINLSANNPSEADRLAALGIAPVVSVVPSDTGKHTRTPDGRLIVTCPAEIHEHITCYTCQLCQRSDRPYIIGFLPIGSRRRKADIIARS